MKKNKVKLALGLIFVAACMLAVGIYKCKTSGKFENEVRIGLVVALTGNASGTGRPIANAVDFLRKKYPAAKFFVEDSKSTPVGGVQAVHKLIDVYGVNVVFCEMTNVSAAIADYTERNKVVFIAPIILSDFVSRWKYTVRDFMTLDEQAKADIDEYEENHSHEGTNLIAIVSNDEFGKSSLDGIQKAIKGRRVKLIEDFTFDSDPELIKNVVINALKNKPNVIFASGFSPALGTLVKELRASGFGGYILTTTAFTAPSIQTAAGDGLWRIIHADFATTKVYDELAEWYLQKYAEKPTLTTFLCHDGVAVIMAASEMCKTSDSHELLDNLENVVVQEGAYGNLSVRNREVKFKLTTNTIGDKK